MTLVNKNIIITGASSGIGKTTAIALAKEGATIIAVARREALLKTLISTLKEINTNNHQYHVLDLTINDEIKKFSKIENNYDGIVHAAGLVSPLPVKFIKQKHIDKVMQLNLYAPMLLNAELLSNRKINNNASIVFISSISTNHPYFGGSLYVASKSAIEAYSRNLALELSTKKIRSNVVSPALVKTEIYTQTIEATITDKLNSYEKKYPFGIGEPEDVANAIVFFISEKSKWITGQNLILDGGLTLNHSE